MPYNSVLLVDYLVPLLFAISAHYRQLQSLFLLLNFVRTLLVMNEIYSTIVSPFVMSVIVC